FSLDSAEPPELLASLLEVLELVVARARRAEQDDVPGRREARRVLDGASERAVVVAPDGGGEPLRSLPDQVDRADVRADRVRQRTEVLALDRAAKDQVDGLRGVGGERSARGGDVRRLRVVDVADAAALGDELEAVRHALELAQRLRDRVVHDSRSARGGGRCG